jgi:hypothetical protein
MPPHLKTSLAKRKKEQARRKGIIHRFLLLDFSFLLFTSYFLLRELIPTAK